MRVYFILFLLLCCVGSVSAQGTYMLMGKVVDKDGNPVEFASVVLADSTAKKSTGTATGPEGTFLLNAKRGVYNLEVSMVGYEKYTLNLTLEENFKLNDIVLKEDISTLKEAKIVANRVNYNMSGYEYKLGDAATLKGKDLTDVLGTAPGIMVIDNITLYGKEVDNIIIDRRKVKVSKDDLLSYLKTYMGENIEKIEVVSNPDVSERYGGTSIKITTKKHTGGFMSASLRYLGNQNKFSISPMTNVDYRKDKFSLYSSLSYMTLNSSGKEVITKDWRDTDKYVKNLTTDKTKLPYSVFGTVGVGYDISKNDYISAELSYRELDNKQKRRTIVESNDMSSLLENSFRDYRMVNRAPTASLMYTHKFKDASELKITGDYVGAYNRNDIVTGKLLKESNTKKDEEFTNTENNTSSFVGYANYSKKIKKSHTFNTGLRYSYIKNEAINNELSFAYDESELTPFASYSVYFKKFGIRSSVQAKWADIDGNDYFDIVPNIDFYYFINNQRGHIVSVGYSRGVSRPRIFQLNPNFTLSRDDVYIKVGNPDLTSYYSSYYSLFLQLFGNFRLSAGYSSSNDAITSYMYSDEDGTIYLTYTNGERYRSASALLNYSNRFFNNMLSVNLSADYMYSKNTLKEKSYNFNSLSYRIELSLNLPKSYSVGAKISGRTSQKVSYNATSKKPVDVTLTFGKRVKRWGLNFEVSDLLNSNKKGHTTLDMGDYKQTVKSDLSYRNFQLRVSYNFSWGKNRGVKRAQTQKNEIMGRIGSN